MRRAPESLATAGEAALGVAGAAGAAAEGLAVAGAAAALVGTAWAIEGGLNAAWASQAGRAEARTATRAGAAARWTSRPCTARRSLGCSSTSLCARASASRAEGPARVRARAARQQPSPFGLNPIPCRGRQSRSDCGPLSAEPSFDQLRSDLELA